VADVHHEDDFAAPRPLRHLLLHCGDLLAVFGWNGAKRLDRCTTHRNLGSRLNRSDAQARGAWEIDRVSIVLYLAMGWSAVLAYESVFSQLSPLSLSFIIAGGMLYSGGVVFHLWDQLRFQNAIWHAFVVAAAAFQYVAVFSSVLAATA
jgi:Haemolysin-III related